MILFFTDRITPRVEYITYLIFDEILKVKVNLTKDIEEFTRSNQPKINYSDTKIGDEIYLKPHSLLFEDKISRQIINPFLYKNETVFFESGPDSVFPFDIFAASFYLVTRYEEYGTHEKDMYGRFRSTDSILSLTGQFKKPVVNIWAGWLANEITKKWPSFSFPEQKFRFISTIDIDNAWAYKNKGFWRFSGALLKSFFKGKPNEVRNRIAFLFRSKKDPYDTYNYLDSVFKGNEDKVIFFLLLGDYHKFDKNISWKNRAFQQLIRLIASKYKTGIHPSYAAGEDLTGKLIKKEKYRLEKITGNPVEFSRMHYLKTEIPSTYRNLVNAGIQMDFTMGFASQNGFRAGICTAFRFYDLENEQCTNLQIVPFQVMDGTLMNYLNYTPDEAEKEISDLMIEVKKVGGTFVSLWHNDTVNDQAEWHGYRKVFEKMCETGFRWTNE